MEAKSSFLHVFEKLESFVGKLPGSLQKPILQEVTPLKDLFLRQRAPRIVLTGDPAAGSAGLFNAIFTAPVAPFAQGDSAHAAPVSSGWKEFSHADRGVLRLLDARVQTGEASADAAQAALTTEPPDLFLFLTDFLSDPPDLARLSADLDRLESLLDLTGRVHQTHPCVVGLVVNSSEQELPLAAMEAARTRLQLAMVARPKVAQHMSPALEVATFMRFRMDGSFDAESDRRYHISELVHTLVAELPNEARLEMARLSGAREAQAKIAQTLVKSLAAISAALGAQPIPLADLPFLLTFQLAMVAGHHLHQRPGTESEVGGTEFFGTMGINLGLGPGVLREGSAGGDPGREQIAPAARCGQRDQRIRGGERHLRDRPGSVATYYYIEERQRGGCPQRLFQRSQRPDQGVFQSARTVGSLRPAAREIGQVSRCLSSRRETLRHSHRSVGATGHALKNARAEFPARPEPGALDRRATRRVEPGDELLEIGPGLGALTGAALETGANLTVLEKDGRLAGHLRGRFPGETRLQVEHMDALDFDVRTLWPRRPVKVFGNLPYYISTPLLFHFTSPDAPVVKAVFLLQRELAERIAAAGPGTKDYGILSVVVGRRWRVELLRTCCPASVFLPEPKVDSALISLTPPPAGRIARLRRADVRADRARGFLTTPQATTASCLRPFLSDENGSGWAEVTASARGAGNGPGRRVKLGLRQWIDLEPISVQPVEPRSAAQNVRGRAFRRGGRARTM